MSMDAGHCKDHEAMMQISKDVAEIKTALLGGYESKGWITRVSEVESEVKSIKRELGWAKGALWSMAGFIGAGAVVFVWQLIAGSVQIITK